MALGYIRSRLHHLPGLDGVRRGLSDRQLIPIKEWRCIKETKIMDVNH